MPHEYNHDSIHFLKSLAEAGQAMEELPRVREELSRTQAISQQLADACDSERNAKELLQGTVEALKAEIAAKEAELAQAKFREGELNAVVDLIRGVLPNASAGPSADPVAESVPDTGGTMNQDQSVMDPTAAADSHGENQSATHAGSTSEAFAGGNSNEEGVTQADRPLPPPNASDSGGSNEQASALTPAGSPVGTDSLTDSLTKEDREPLGEVGTLKTTSPSESDTLTHGTSSSHSDKPYLGWSSHRKPQNLTWGDFERLGGYRPYWCNPDLT